MIDWQLMEIMNTSSLYRSFSECLFSSNLITWLLTTVNSGPSLRTILPEKLDDPQLDVEPAREGEGSHEVLDVRVVAEAGPLRHDGVHHLPPGPLAPQRVPATGLAMMRINFIFSFKVSEKKIQTKKNARDPYLYFSVTHNLTISFVINWNTYIFASREFLIFLIENFLGDTLYFVLLI